MEKHKGAGHRQRLRNKFLNSGIDAFHDYEIIELLLTLGTPRSDCKEQAKAALKKFKTLRGVLEAPVAELQEIPGIGPNNVFGLKLTQEVARKFLKEKIIKKQVCKSSNEVFNYLFHSMRDLKKEIFKVIFLDSKNRIVAEETLFEGTVNASSVYPRDIMSKALQYNAVSIIVVHNHPTGIPQPSQSDTEITKKLVSAGDTMQIKVLDHIIIGDNTYYSFADEDLIDKYSREID